MESGYHSPGAKWSMLNTVLTPSGQSETGNNHRAQPGTIWKARCYIHDHLGEALSLTTVADCAGISANYLSEKFKEITGERFVDYVAQRRYHRACQLLQNRETNVSEIAFEVGFQSLSQFNRVFKKLSGQSPSRYRAAGCPINGSGLQP